MNSIARLTRFITTDIWRIRIDSLTLSRSLIVKPLRVAVLALRGFDENKCSLKASALTFYTLMSIVPVVALAFGIAKGFGFEDKLQQQLLEKLQGQEEVIRRVIDFAHTLLENTKGGLVAGIGVMVLFWTVIKLLGNIEASFNEIWGIEKSRTLARKFSDYLSAMLALPAPAYSRREPECRHSREGFPRCREARGYKDGCSGYPCRAQAAALCFCLAAVYLYICFHAQHKSENYLRACRRHCGRHSVSAGAVGLYKVPGRYCQQ